MVKILYALLLTVLKCVFLIVLMYYTQMSAFFKCFFPSIMSSWLLCSMRVWDLLGDLVTMFLRNFTKCIKKSLDAEYPLHLFIYTHVNSHTKCIKKSLRPTRGFSYSMFLRNITKCIKKSLNAENPLHLFIYTPVNSQPYNLFI
jgi:hypothetical protein